MKLVKPSFLLRSLYPSLIWKLGSNEKKLYLSFDDGPIPEVTPWVLEQLRIYKAKATFFCVGDNVRKYPHLKKAILEEQHKIGNHSNNHLNGWHTDNDLYFANVETAAKVIDSKLFRPPYGKIKRKQIAHLKSTYNIIMWDVLSYDFNAKVSAEQCLQNVIENAENGSIVVFHDSIKAWKNLEFALPKTLAHFADKGYKFEVIPDF